MALSRTQRIALVADLAAIAVLLNQLIDIPAPYAGFLKYEVWEIPVVVAFLIAGLYTGILVGIINALVLELKAGIPSGPWYNFAAMLSMVAGMYLAERIGGWKSLSAKNVAFSTALGALSRTLIMTIVNYTFLPLGYPIGFNLPVQVVVGYLPLIAFFNLTTALYTVPASYIVFRAMQVHKVSCQKT